MSNIKPTAAELEILTLLWEHGPSSVRDIHKQLSTSRDVFYTTTLKTMQVMHNKRLLDRDTSQRAHVYSPAVPQNTVEKSLLGGLRASLFKGSTAQLVISALGHDRPSQEELVEIRSLLDKLEEDDNA